MLTSTHSLCVDVGMKVNTAALKAWRKERGLTILALATAAGIPQPNLSKIEAGQEQPSWKRLATLAQVLGIEPAALVGPTINPDETAWPFVQGRKRRAA